MLKVSVDKLFEFKRSNKLNIIFGLSEEIFNLQKEGIQKDERMLCLELKYFIMRKCLLNTLSRL